MTPETFVNESAQCLNEKLVDALATYKKVFILLSGGSSIELYRKLFEFLPKNVDLSTTTWALIDERRVAITHEDSNEGALRANGIVQNIEERKGVYISMSTVNAQDTYEQAFKDAEYVFAFVGIGEDGHTAGWLPTQTQERFHLLYEQTHALVSYDVDADDSQNAHRARMTLSTLYVKKINQVILYAVGKKKHLALEQFIANKQPVHQVPALVLYQSKNPVILLSDYSRIASFNAP